MSQIFTIATSIRTIMTHLEKGIATLDEPARSQFQKALATARQDPMLRQLPVRWIHPIWQQPEHVSEDTFRSAQHYLERVSMEIKEEVKDLMKTAEIVDALKRDCVPALSKALFCETKASE